MDERLSEQGCQLYKSARQVLDNWSDGDLASAVRELARSSDRAFDNIASMDTDERELIRLSFQVVQRWECGDLASAVRDLGAHLLLIKPRFNLDEDRVQTTRSIPRPNCVSQVQ